jgi:hypothetical protein
MNMIISRYHKAWLKMCQYNKDRTENCDSTSAKDEVSWEVSSCETEKGRSEDMEKKEIRENNSRSGKQTKGRHIHQLKQGNGDKRTTWRVQSFFVVREGGGDSKNTKRK